MTSSDFSAPSAADRTPEEIFAAINDVRGRWSGNIEGCTDSLGPEFTYRNHDVDDTKQRISEVVPSQRVAWRVEESFLNFTDEAGEWVAATCVTRSPVSV